MKTMLGISCVMLALTTTAALAQGGLNLNWGPDCASDASVTNKNFACDTNSGSSTMVASYVPMGSHERLVSVEAVIDGQSCDSSHPYQAMPDWWQFRNANSCRLTALSVNATYAGTGGICRDAWAGQGMPIVSYRPDSAWVLDRYVGYYEARWMRMTVSCAVPVEIASAVEGGLEYTVFNVVVNHTKTVGTGACSGCAVPAWWVFNYLTAEYLDAGVSNREWAMSPIMNQVITWQGGQYHCIPDAVQNRTWGQVKSLYR
jgi:hypothetical protein